METENRPLRLDELKMEVTYQCELNCVHCSSDAHPSNLLEMSRQDCLRILDQAAEMGVHEVIFSGGEPLLWPHIVAAVDNSVRHGMSAVIYTSGSVSSFEDRIDQLVNVGISKTVFSIFGATSASHERVTRKAKSFERTVHSAEAALEKRLTTELHFVPMSNNYQELKEIVRLAYELGASRVSLLRLVPQGRATLMKGRALSHAQNIELRHIVKKLRRKHGEDFIRTGSPYSFLFLGYSPKCLAGLDRLVINPSLEIFPCDAFKKIAANEIVNTSALSSLDQASLFDCWDMSPYLKAIREYLNSEYESPCSNCESLDKCASGCLAQKVIAYGSLTKKPDPDCLKQNLGVGRI